MLLDTVCVWDIPHRDDLKRYFFNKLISTVVIISTGQKSLFYAIKYGNSENYTSIWICVCHIILSERGRTVKYEPSDCIHVTHVYSHSPQLDEKLQQSKFYLLISFFCKEKKINKRDWNYSALKRENRFQTCFNLSEVKEGRLIYPELKVAKLAQVTASDEPFALNRELWHKWHGRHQFLHLEFISSVLLV